ncbi:MAG: SGNH/GDSL hydrolase family protein [Planctomycetaceae bacterium]|nr:SGNH/GDSL hydrolase family protein [Planctomycetaceae bacterium]
MNSINIGWHRTATIGTVLSLTLTVALSAANVNAAPSESPQYEPVAAQILKPRGGLANTFHRINAGKSVRVAYLGGSITAAAGWRVKSLAWLKEQFPQSEFTEIHAAIGGTGSDLGVYRLGRDVLDHNPDLLFVEFAVNDGGAAPENIWRAMEGIVRQTWSRFPHTDICFVYTFRVGYEEDLNKELCPRAASAMEMLADHYQIPSVNFALRIVQLQQEGKLVYQAEAPPSDGRTQFSKDGVHPLDEGHQIYTNVLAGAILQMKTEHKPEAELHSYADRLQNSFISDHWQQAKMVPVSAEMMSSEWKQLAADHPLARSFSGRMGTLWEANSPGSRLTFRFRGSAVKLYDLLGPDGGQVTITVDGETRPKPVARFDSYCTYHRIATLNLASGLNADSVHEVTIEIHPDQPDRQSVAFRLQDPETELKSPKYQGHAVRVSQIMLLGDLLTE